MLLSIYIFRTILDIILGLLKFLVVVLILGLWSVVFTRTTLICWVYENLRKAKIQDSTTGTGRIMNIKADQTNYYYYKQTPVGNDS
jgi:hypothetical protein